MKRSLLTLFVFFVYYSAIGQIPSGGLVAFYPFCDDTTNHAVAGNDLINSTTSSGNPVLATDRFFNANTAFDFDGVNGIMHTATFFSAAGDFTYSCWIYPRVSQSACIIFNGNDNSNGYGIMMNNGTAGTAGDKVAFVFGNQGDQLSQTVALNQWHHIVISRGGNSYQMYVDTVLVGSFSGYFYPLNSTNVFTVGMNYNTSAEGFNGKIDDIAVYNTHLSHSDIVALYKFDPDITPYTLGNDTAICTNSVTLSPSPATPGAKYAWSTGDSTTSITVTPADFPGTDYSLNMYIPYGCSSADTINVRHITVNVKLGNDTTFCSGNTLVLNTPHPGERFTWSTGDTTGTLSVTATGTYWLSIDSLGCYGSDTISVTTLPQPSVHLGPDTALCQGGSVTLQSSDTTYSTGATYVWGAYPVLTSPVTTPTLTVTSTGTYWLTVTDHGCPGADTIHVLIVYDTFHFLQPDTALCLGGTFQPDVTSNPNITYQWRPTTGMPVSNVASPTITTSVSTTYVLTTSYAGCPDSVDSFHLDIQPNPTINFLGPPRSVCTGDTVHITVTVTPSDYTHYIYNWTPGTNLDDPTSPTIVFTAGDTTTLYITVSTPHGCSALDSAQINVHPTGYASLDSVQFDRCPGDSVHLMPLIDPTTNTIATFKWTPTIYQGDTTSSSPWVYPETSEDYTAVGTSQFGCKDTLRVSIIVHPAAVIFLPDSVIIYPGGSYQLSPQTNCTNFIWTPSIGLSDTLTSDPLASPPVNTKYYVFGTTTWGCRTEDSITMHVEPSTLINMPNAFTPGAGINSLFKVLKDGLASINYFRIYDRWGNEVFNTTSIDEGWDGTYKGKAQPFGVYVYELEVVTNTGHVYKRQGNVTLIR